jgi:hypothetical protein
MFLQKYEKQFNTPSTLKGVGVVLPAPMTTETMNTPQSQESLERSCLLQGTEGPQKKNHAEFDARRNGNLSKKMRRLFPQSDDVIDKTNGE